MKRFSQVIAQVAWLAALVLVLGGSLHAASPTPNTDIIPFGSSWKYLNPQTFNQDPFFNLELVDFDFEWFLPNYDEADLTVDDGGPVTLSWQGPAPSPIGYGAIVGFPNGFATDIGQPASGERYTVYLRGESFTRPAGVSQAGPFGIEFLADDGMAMYLDGVEIDLDVNDISQKRYNCCQDIGAVPIPRSFPPTYLDRSLASGDENNFITRRLSDMTLSAGQHMIAVSLHNQATTSSDLGFEMRLYVIPEPSTATLAVFALAAVTCLRRRTLAT